MTLETKTSADSVSPTKLSKPGSMGSLSSPSKTPTWQTDIPNVSLCPYDCRACESSKKQQLRLVVKLFSEDGTSRSLEIPAGTSARDVCQSLILKNNCVDDNSWALIEHLPHLSLERTLEDHELVAQVQSTWGIDCDNKLFFRKNYAKYEFFKNPLQFFPEHMVSMPYESNGSIPHSQLIQNFMNSSSCPEIQGYLHVKEPGRKSWKKLYFFLRRSGLYFSTKGTSRETVCNIVTLYQECVSLLGDHTLPGKNGGF